MSVLHMLWSQPCVMKDGKFRFEADISEAKGYDPMKVYAEWKRDSSVPVPFIDFMNLEVGDLESMRVFFTRWGSLDHANFMSVNEAQGKLIQFKDLAIRKRQLENGWLNADQANKLSVDLEIHTRDVRATTVYYDKEGGGLEKKTAMQVPDLFTAMVQMLAFEIGDKAITRKCHHERCGKVFTSARTKLYCSKECTKRASVMRATDKRYPGRADRRKERLGRK